MAAVPTVTADGVKICELAKARYGSVTAFAASIGRHRNAIWNMRQPRRSAVSIKNITEVAGALGVPVSEITIEAPLSDTAAGGTEAWAVVLQSGHWDCGGWKADPRNGLLACECGTVLREAAGAGQEQAA